MIYFKKIFALLTFTLILGLAARAQEAKKEIHFLADTINVDAKNRIVEIGREGDHPFYAFYCKCISPYDSLVAFIYPKGKTSSNIQAVLPKHNFIAWKDFSDIISKEQTHLSKAYRIYITEVLPGNKYKTNEVELSIINREKTIDYQIIKGPHKK